MFFTFYVVDVLVKVVSAPDDDTEVFYVVGPVYRTAVVGERI